MRVGGIWEAAAPLPGGRGLPPCCRAAWGAGRPAVGRPVLQRLFCKNFREIFTEKPMPPRSGATRSGPPGCGAAGVYSCKFRKRKYIFVKNENKKYIKKNRFNLGGYRPEVDLKDTWPTSKLTEDRILSSVQHGPRALPNRSAPSTFRAHSYS